MMLRAPRNRRGSTFALVVLVLAILTASGAMMLQQVTNEQRMAGDSKAANDAYALAQSGIEFYLSTRSSAPSASQDTTITSVGGSADLGIRQVRAGAAPLWVIRSRGVSTMNRQGVRVPQAERTIAAFMTWTAGSFSPVAAWTSLSGLSKNGNSGSMSGVDACGVKPPGYGVAVPSGGYSGPTGPIDGSPDNTPRYLGTGGPGGQAKDSANVDWSGIVNGTSLTPDYAIPGASWPNSSQMNAWPTIKVTGDYTLPGDGKGVLIVTGDLTINGSTQWNGIILVGGNLTSNGNNTVNGAVMTGLNIKLGQTVATGSVGNGNKTFQYNSCSVDSAMARFGGAQRIRNAVGDNWAMY